MPSMKIALGSDHAGFFMKEAIKKFLKKREIDVTDVGCFSEKPVDYPDIAKQAGEAVSCGRFDRGILICGSGNGMAMVANRFPHIRAAVAWNREIASLAWRHNMANILCLPARFITVEEGPEMVAAWLDAEFEGERHQRRLEKIVELERHLR